jgi:hypothetical protein
MYTKKGGYAVNDITGCQIINPGSYASMIFVLPESKIDDYYYNGIVGGSLIEWCKQFCSKDGTFIDIGAKTGVYSICLSEVSRNVYSFEKKKLDYYALCGSVALSNQENVTCLQDGAESLDENVLINNEECIKFIKIDLENEELNVLKGAKNLLTKNNYPTILLHTNRNKTPELFDFLENELQYRIVNISGNDNVVLAVCK